MSQEDMVIANAPGATVRADINANLQALASCSKGPSAPSTPYAGQLWLDDDTPSASVWTLKQYDGSDWIELGKVDSTNNVFAVATAQAQNVASASTIDLDAAYGMVVDVTGTTAITAITLAQGQVRIVRFTGSLTLTNGASLVLPGAANILTQAGDFAIFVGYGSSVVRCVSYTVAAATPVRSASIQNGGDTNNSSSGSGSDYDHDLTYTIPANFLTSGRALRVTAHFEITTGSSAPNITHKLKFGSTELADHQPVTPNNNIADDSYALQWIVQATSAPGDTATVEAALMSVPTAPLANTQRNLIAQPVTVDTDSNITLQIATLWSAAGTGTNTIKLSQLWVEVMN